MKQKVLVVWPQMRDSMLYTFNHMERISGKKAGFIPLPAATGAAYVPEIYDVRIIDENVSGTDWLAASLEGVALAVLTFMNVQYSRALEITRELQQRGVRVAWAGTYVTRDPWQVRSPADYVLAGPAEGMADLFFRDFSSGRARRAYFGSEDSRFQAGYRKPRFDLLEIEKYGNGMVQTSEGCVFNCAFCSERHRPDLRPIAYVLSDLDELYRLGVKSVMFADANLWVGPGRFRELMLQLANWNQQRGWPIRFSGEVSLNLADNPEMVDLLVQAGFMVVYPGIETLTAEGLLAIGKSQNVSKKGFSLEEMIRKYQEAGLEVMAGFIAGFDHDHPGVFKEITDFVERAGIIFTTAGGLIPMPGTRIYEQLREEGRLIAEGGALMDAAGHASANFGGGSNFFPKNMTREQLEAGAKWMRQRLATIESFRKRLWSYTRNMGLGHRVLARRYVTDRESLRIFRRIWSVYWRDKDLRPAARTAAAAAMRYPRKIGLVTRAMCEFYQFRRSAQDDGLEVDNVPRRLLFETSSGQLIAG